MRYLLDTDVVIDVSRGINIAVARVDAWFVADDEVSICAIQISEFFAGVAPTERERQQRFLGAFVVWEIGWRAALHAGAYRHDFARRGVQMSTPDALIAAVAWDYSATLVTRNRRHFPMTDIRIVTI